MKKNISFKRILISLFLMLFPIYVFASGGVTVSKSSITLGEGGSTTFNIVAKNAAGKVKISSEDTSIATVNKSTEWVENESLTVTVKAVKPGKTNIKIVIEAATFDEEEIETTKKIAVTVSEPKSEVNNLTDLKINGTTLSGFSSSKTSYSYSTEEDSIEITATKEDDKSSISGTGTKKLKYGSNKFTIKVTAENGKTKSYIITVNKKDDRNSNNNLKDLKIDGLTIDGFSSSKTSYTLSSDKTSINISATAEESKSTVSGAGTKTIKEGSNKFTIKVTAENETTKSYIITINKGITNTPVVEPEKVKYTLKYDNESLHYCPTAYAPTVEAIQGEKWGTLCVPEREGYTFVGWYTEKEGGDFITENNYADKNLTVYAHWREQVKKETNQSSNLNTIVIVLVAILSFSLGGLVTYFTLKKRM